MSLDERKVCDRCGAPFRCPTAQAERFTCGPCLGPNQSRTTTGPVPDQSGSKP